MIYHLFPRYIQATHLAAVVVHAELLADWRALGVKRGSRIRFGLPVGRNLMGGEIW